MNCPLMPRLRKSVRRSPTSWRRNFAGNQITNFLKQYAEYGLKFPVAGFGFDTRRRVGRGKGRLLRYLRRGTMVDTPSSEKYVDAFQKKYGKLPDNAVVGRLQLAQDCRAVDEER